MTAAKKLKAVSRPSFYKQHTSQVDGMVLAFPYLILFALFTVVPVVISLILSFTSFNVLQPPEFVFLDNYVKLLLEDDIFSIALKNTLLFAAVTGPVGYMLCFLFAWCLNEMPRGLRTGLLFLLYAPSISGNAYLMWTLLFSGDSHGYINGLLLRMGMIYEPVRWFQNPAYMVPLVIAVILWMSLGTSMLVFVAGFQGIDRSLFEAGAVDGVRNRWQELWYITLPSMKPQLLFSAVMSITAAFGVGDVITGLVGFPSYKYMAHTLMHHLQDYGGMRFEMGYASAIATLLFIMMIGGNMVIQRIISKVGG